MKLDVDRIRKGLKDEKNIPAQVIETIIDQLKKDTRKLNFTKKMLKDSAKKDITITEIYLAVGFNSKSVFYTFFKKLEGMTPTKYRQLN